MSLQDFAKANAKITGHQIETKDLLGKELTLLSMTPRKTKNGEAILVRFKEDPEGFYFGGKTTIELYESFKGCDVDIEAEETKVKYTMVDSKNGRTYVNVEVTNLPEV